MGKSKLEYRSRCISMDTDSWSAENRKIERMCREMQEDGWTLLTMAFADPRNAALVFTRPMRDER